MTLCVAWVRRATQPPELVFATDSRLSAPGRWDLGIKLFEVPRRGALIAFHGETFLAHPLLQHLEHNFLERDEFRSPACDLHDLAEPIAAHFTELVNQIRDLNPGMTKSLEEHDKSKTGFLLAGWSWRQQGFAIWRITYAETDRKFVAVPVIAVNGNVFAFVGDDVPAAESDLLADAQAGPLNMQPLRVLHRRTHPDSLASTIGGPLQAAKVYASGQVEFFSVAWPSADDDLYRRAARLGQRGLRDPVFLDPATGEEVSVLPDALPIDENYDWGSEEAFIRYCYPTPSFELRTDLRDHEKQRLVAALKAVGFERLVSSFADGHTVASKLLRAQADRLREIASRAGDGETRQAIESFLNEPFEKEEVEPAVTEEESE